MTKTIRRSRWIRGSSVERYDKRTLDAIYSVYREADGWHNAARVTKR